MESEVAQLGCEDVMEESQLAVNRNVKSGQA